MAKNAKAPTHWPTAVEIGLDARTLPRASDVILMVPGRHVEAVQMPHDAGPTLLAAIAHWCEAAHYDTERGTVVIFANGGQRIVCYPGDWIWRDDRGDWRMSKDSVFRRRFAVGLATQAPDSGPARLAITQMEVEKQTDGQPQQQTEPQRREAQG